MKKALFIVDVQNDFCPGGALAVPNGDQVVEPLNRMIEHAEQNRWLVVPSKDWHPVNHCSFKKQGGSWPPHCIQNTPGAELHPDLKINSQFTVLGVRKGYEQDKDSYSAFGGGILINRKYVSPEQFLRKYGIYVIYIGGLATDYCVKAIALDAIRLGFKTYLLTDACRAVNVKPGDEALALNEMENARVEFTTTDEVIHGEETR